MKDEKTKIFSAVRRDHAGNYMLISLVAFAVTVIVTRVFLEMTGYPQIGNSVLHIAHALWGGLLLIIAAILPLAYVNHWAFQVSALLGGIGIGLFIDEVGKFITQTNDYFFPPALPLIYGFILLNVVLYIYIRRPHQEDPRNAMYHVLEGLQDALDGDLDTNEAARIEAQLAIARGSDRKEIVSLADAISAYLQQEKNHLSTAKPAFWKQISKQIDAFGQRLGRYTHRVIISGLMILWVIFVVGYIVMLIQGSTTIDHQVLQWRGVLIGVQVVIGILMVTALLTWLTGKEERGLNFAVGGFLLSLVALQTLYFYISQFSAISATLLQFLFLQILFAYRRWYLRNGQMDSLTDTMVQ
jgi:hypothetical protein